MDCNMMKLEIKKKKIRNPEAKHQNAHSLEHESARAAQKGADITRWDTD